MVLREFQLYKKIMMSYNQGFREREVWEMKKKYSGEKNSLLAYRTLGPNILQEIIFEYTRFKYFYLDYFWIGETFIQDVKLIS